MGGIGWELALVLALVVLNAAFAGSEMALVALREGQLRRLSRSSRRGRSLARLAGDPNRFLATTQLGITLAGFLASAAAAVSLAGPLVPLLRFLGPAAHGVAVVLVTTALTFVTLVLGELVPKRIALQRAERWALWAARPLTLAELLSRPAVWLLSRATNLVVRLLGGDPHATREEVGTEELRELVATRGEFSAQQRQILSGAFEIADRTVRQIRRPRGAVVCVPRDLPADRALRRLAGAGRSRAPVTGEGGLDDVLGVVHVRDLVGGERPVAGYARPAMFVPEALRVAEAMRQMRQQRQQLAVVVDEWGAGTGIVTMEDLLEEVVGELYDETDRDVCAVSWENDGSLLLPGDFPLHDLPDVGVRVDVPPSAEYTTVAGLLLARLGHIPDRAGERVRVPPVTLQVADVDAHAITRVRLRSDGGG